MHTDPPFSWFKLHHQQFLLTQAHISGAVSKVPWWIRPHIERTKFAALNHIVDYKKAQNDVNHLSSFISVTSLLHSDLQPYKMSSFPTRWETQYFPFKLHKFHTLTVPEYFVVSVSLWQHKVHCDTSETKNKPSYRNKFISADAEIN